MLIPFSVAPALFFEGLLPGDKRVNRYYISIEILNPRKHEFQDNPLVSLLDKRGTVPGNSLIKITIYAFLIINLSNLEFI